MFEPKNPIATVMLHGGKHNYIYFDDGTFAEPEEVKRVQTNYRKSRKN